MDESNCLILQKSVPAPEEQNAEHRIKSKYIVTHTLVGALGFPAYFQDWLPRDKNKQKEFSNSAGCCGIYLLPFMINRKKTIVQNFSFLNFTQDEVW